MNGGVVCTDLMCIGGLVNGTSIQYTLQSLGRAQLGWIAMGFGTQMANTPMVIMWPNSDGSITLSQRHAPAEVMPTVDSAPPRTASLQTSSSVTTGTNPKYVFTIDSDGANQKSIIWAFGGTNPGDSAADATLLQHLESGPTQIDLSGALASDSKDPTNPVSTIAQSTSSGGASSSGNQTAGNDAPVFAGIPLLPYERYIVAHALISMLGFLVFLPLGAIVARWARTFSGVWFTLHWIIQFCFALPLIVTGFALGVTAVKMNGVPQLGDTHMKWGVALFVLYFVQISLGAVIHFVKPTPSYRLRIRGRTLQNYFHAILGLLIIGIAFYQVRTGFRVEWPLYTGRGKVANGANIVWIIWLVLVPAVYFGGLVFLQRQYRQELSSRPDTRSGSDGSDAHAPIRPAETY
ncbi:CBD9-like protein [Trametopsis cervina]|nr:CBD9-like protein [Trametopsis cervina]